MPQVEDQQVVELADADRLRRSGLRVTAARLAVLAVLRSGGHQGVEAIGGAVKERLGTMSTQALFGAFFGRCMERWRLNARDKACLARRMSGRTLLWGGLVFFLVGLAGQFLPLGRLYVVTPIRVHNLHQLGVGFFLVVVALFAVAFWSLRRSVRELTGPSKG